MVTFVDIGKRHILYCASVVLVILCAHRSRTLAVLQTIIISLLVNSARTPLVFAALVGGAGTIVVSVCTICSTHTFWFADGLAYVEVPCWLPMTLGIAGHWVVDVFHFVTIHRFRRVTLP